MVVMRTRFILALILLLVLAFLLCCCGDITQGANDPRQAASDTAESQTEGQRSQMEILESLEDGKEQILAFWEAHEDELEAIALDFIEFERENTDAERPYTDYRPENGLMVGDGLGNGKKAEAPLLEQQLEHIFALSDCPFNSAGPSTHHDWLDADYCEFTDRCDLLPDWTISLVYLPDATFEIPEMFRSERVSEQWAIITNWYGY